MVQFRLVDTATKSDLRLENLHVYVLCSGFLVETRIELTFRNETQKEIEGELLIPLEENETVCGFAIDIAGKMVDGVIVEKQKARSAH